MTPLVRCLLLAVLVIGSLTAVADKPAADAERIAQLINDLGSDKFEQREAAAKALDQIGLPALEALRKAEKAEDAEIRQRATLLVGSIESRYLHVKLFAKHVTQGIALVHESFVLDVSRGELAAWAVRGLYQAGKAKITAELEKRLAGSKELKEPEVYALLFDARLRLGVRPDLDKSQDIFQALRFMIKRLDTYGDFYDPVLFAQGPRLVGIGLDLRADPITGAVGVYTPFKDGPAHKAGLRAGDVVTHITRKEDDNGRALPQPEVTPVQGLEVAQVSQKLLGQAGTKVHVTIQRTGEPKPLEFELVRGAVRGETVLGRQRNADDSWNYQLDAERQIGYVRLTQFARESASDMKLALQQLDKAGLKGCILDLRFNPGGLLPGAIDIAEMLIDDGVIMRIGNRHGHQDTYTAEATTSFLRFPLVCLINSASASASEILAACLQDHRRALIMGERSRGKGSVQNILPFPPLGYEIKLTTALFYRPTGQKLDRMQLPGRAEQEWGVLPQPAYSVPLSDKEQQRLREHLEQQTVIRPRGQLPPETGFEDRQLSMALKFLREQVGNAAAKRR